MSRKQKVAQRSTRACRACVKPDIQEGVVEAGHSEPGFGLLDLDLDLVEPVVEAGEPRVFGPGM